ncbi:hypothetical protein RB195_016015 [Necator americanus]|uniref:Uncharacterized protein n=1 Tax=Necator americanus TaxID=51031 RepID=A0ABR1E773_NECAM
MLNTCQLHVSIGCAEVKILKEKGSWPQEMLDTLKDFLRWERVIRPVDRSPIGDLVPVYLNMHMQTKGCGKV